MTNQEAARLLTRPRKQTRVESLLLPSQKRSETSRDAQVNRKTADLEAFTPFTTEEPHSFHYSLFFTRYNLLTYRPDIRHP